jgi:hypothetical protein
MLRQRSLAVFGMMKSCNTLDATRNYLTILYSTSFVTKVLPSTHYPLMPAKNNRPVTTGGRLPLA